LEKEAKLLTTLNSNKLETQWIRETQAGSSWTLTGLDTNEPAHDFLSSYSLKSSIAGVLFEADKVFAVALLMKATVSVQRRNGFLSFLLAQPAALRIALPIYESPARRKRFGSRFQFKM
jgi:hypothetical protein